MSYQAQAIRIQKSRYIVDQVKRRSTLVKLVAPIGIAIGLLEKPSILFKNLKGIGAPLIHGDPGQAKGGIETLVRRAFHVEGIGGWMYRSSLLFSAATNVGVGGFEIHQGVKHRDQYILAMGCLDLGGAASSILFVMGFPIPSLAVAIFSAATKTGLVFSRPKEYSRIQKASSLFSVVSTVNASLLRNGVGILPALASTAVQQTFELLYMNHHGFQKRVDRMVDQLIRHSRKWPDSRGDPA